MDTLYTNALKNIGYDLAEGSTLASQVREAFQDWHDSGHFQDLEPEDIEDLSTEQLAKALLRVR